MNMLHKPPESEELKAQTFTENVIPQLLAWRDAGIESALVTLVGVEGSAPRRLGSQMAVNADGDYVGYISNGCAEGAIVEEAISAIKSKTSRHLRYGAGSKYIDIVLPCGSGIDVYFDQGISTDALKRLQSAILNREPVGLTFDFSEQSTATIHPLVHETNAVRNPSNSGAPYTRSYLPPPRIVIAGRGPYVDYVARFADQLEWEVIVASPDKMTLANTSAFSSAQQYLNIPKEFDASVVDASTALVLLFHDHEWEPEILSKCAAMPAFYVGALGSRQTHEQRKLLLSEIECDENFIERIRAPIGLPVRAGNPPEVALSIVTEIMDVFSKRRMTTDI